MMYSTRIRFNWGFHDATSDRENGRANRINSAENPRFPLPVNDKAYSIGYAYGQKCEMVVNVRPETSQAAWMEYKGERN